MSAHKAALEARDKKAAASARLRIVAAMLGVQFGHPDVEEETQTLRLKVDNAACEVRYATRDVECADAATITLSLELNGGNPILLRDANDPTNF